MSIKIKTQDIHTKAEQNTFNSRLAKGELTESEYLFYLYQLKHLFTALERGELPHPDMYRVSKIEQDIQELKSQNPIELFVVPSIQQYVDHLNSLSDTDLLPHIYTNYFAVLFGGQMIKVNAPGAGAMYEFDNKDQIIQAIRSLEQDQWEHEVRKAFEFNIEMCNDIQRIFN